MLFSVPMDCDQLTILWLIVVADRDAYVHVRAVYLDAPLQGATGVQLCTHDFGHHYNGRFGPFPRPLPGHLQEDLRGGHKCLYLSVPGC
jgi:hypothetical protein